MTTSATTLPPPLSDAPSVETLERLLVGLNQPMQRGVPSPPGSDQPPDVGMFEPVAPAPTQTGPPSLSWSAAQARRGRWTPAVTALGVAAVTAAGVVAGLVATGEIALP